MKEVSALFGIGLSTLSITIREVCAAIISTLSSSIAHPSSPYDWQTVVAEFGSFSGTPNIAGAIDCTHIAIKKPPTDKKNIVYVNRKKYTSVVLQGTVRANGRFMDCAVGWGGGVEEAQIFNNSPFGSQMKKGLPSPSR